MNQTLKNAAKEILVNLLNQCSQDQFLIFKRMYCPKNLDASIEVAVNLIKDEKIDWAITQCEKTVAKNSLAN